ncbi:MAG: hypothetical protein AAGA48_14015 [Myxococcota bacterium]
MLGWILWIFALQAGFAADEIVIERPADIVPLLPPPDATQWDASKVVEAIRVSAYSFTPSDVYDLVDRQAPARVVEAVAQRAGEPYDPTWRPIDAIAAEARQGQTGETLKLDAATIGRLFTTLEGLQKEVDRARRSVAPLAPRGSGETARLYERRARRHAIDVVRAVGPAQGRIEATTFEVVLPVAQETRGGCKRPVALADLSAMPFSTFRAGMGVLHRVNEVSVTSSTIEHAEFSVNNGFRFEIWGRCGEVAEEARIVMRRTHDGQWSGRGDM